jgi:signal transduction histidine kinase
MVDLFSALRGMFKPILTNAEVSLFFDDPVDVPRVYTDNKKLSQILRNFISNALKFTTRGEVRVSATRQKSHVVFSVKDTGIGISKEFHSAIFEDFVQVESPLQKHYRGTGLGLSLSKKLAELLGGSVAVSSDLGKGSTFSVAIPLHAGQEDGGSSRSNAEAAERGYRNSTLGDPTDGGKDS